MTDTWKLGLQRVRDPSKVTVELLADDMGGNRPLAVRYQDPGSEIWDLMQLRSEGRSYPDKASPWDLMPPLMTRNEVIKDCVDKYVNANDNILVSMSAAIGHYDMLRREGRVEE